MLVKGFYDDKHPMPGMAYLELKGSLVTKEGNKIKGSATTLYDMRNVHDLVHNPNNSILSPCHLHALVRGFMYPDQ
jgi:hypothetical protein